MEWLCERCGAPQESNDSPCDNCGHARFEKPYVQRSDDLERTSSTLQWVCEECGRAHPKHSPPCSRCGHMTLERADVSVDPADVSAPSYRELATPLQLAAFVVALLAAGVLGLGVLGVADVPGFGDPEIPAESSAPGNATSIYGTPANDVEADYLATVNDARADQGATRLERSDDLDRIATYNTRSRVRAEHGTDTIPYEEVTDLLRSYCSGSPIVAAYEIPPLGLLSDGDDGVAIAESILEDRDDLARTSASETGLDLHAGPEGSVFLTQIVC